MAPRSLSTKIEAVNLSILSLMTLNAKIVELKLTKYQDANFNHFVELLELYENIKVSYSSTHRILTQAGIKSPKNIVSLSLTTGEKESLKRYAGSN